MVLPVVVALVAYWRRGGFEPETGLLNGDEAGARRSSADAAPADGRRQSCDYRPLCHARAPARRWPSSPSASLRC